MKPEGYSGCSFQIGAAMKVATCGVPAETIMTLGNTEQFYVARHYIHMFLYYHSLAFLFENKHFDSLTTVFINDSAEDDIHLYKET